MRLGLGALLHVGPLLKFLSDGFRVWGSAWGGGGNLL